MLSLVTDAVAIFRSLYLIRRVEEEIARIYPTDKIQSPVHLSIGQELASVAVCAALRPTDKVFGSYRSHALYLAKGGNLRAFIAELYGRVTGCARGKGGSMHMVEPQAGLLGTSAVVASQIPIAVGYAWAQKLLGTGVVTAVFFGDGACEEGVYYEALNLAALHSLPILFVCENNGYAIASPLEARQSTAIERRARAFGLEAGSPFTYDQALAWPGIWIERIRAGNGPAHLTFSAPRLKEHVGPQEDWAQGYRALDPDWFDPLLEADLAAERATSPAALDRMKDEVEAEIADAFAFAESSPFPAPAELLANTYG